MDFRKRGFRVTDLAGPIGPRMWHYGAPYFSPELEMLAQPEWLESAIYSEAVRMPLQTGTYLETAAHVFRDRERIGEIPLERTVLVPAVAVQLGCGPRESIQRQVLERAVSEVLAPPYEGVALLVGTGWDKMWEDPAFVDNGPFFSEDAIEYVVEMGFGILGGDTARFDNPDAPTGHLYKLFSTDALLLAPLYNLGEVGNAVGWLIAAPLKMEGASASPVRAVWVEEGDL